MTYALLALLLAAAPPPPAAAAPQAAGQRAPAGSHVVEPKRAGDWPAQPSGKVVTLEASVTLDDALQKVAAAAGWSLIARTGRLGEREVVVTLRATPVEEALAAVLEGTPLVATRRGNTVTVAPRVAPPAEEQPVLSGFDQPTGKRFSGDFTDEPIAQALRKVSDAAGLSVVFPPGVTGVVNGHFREAPVEDVLRALLGQGGLVARREGSIVTVARSAGGSLVIRGGKRALSFPPGAPDGDLGSRIEGTVRDAVREARESAKKARDEARAARRKARAVEGDEGEKRGGSDRVLRGDQVVAAGERAGDVVVLLGSVRFEPAAAANQVVAVVGSVDLGPGVTVDADVVAVGGDVHVSPGAHVGGDAVAVGGKIIIDQGGEVEGQQTSVDAPGLSEVLGMVGLRSSGVRPRSPWVSLAHALLQFAVLFGVGLLLFVVAPRRLDAVAGSLGNAPVKAVLTGVLGVLAVPVAALLLAVTVVGIPLIAVLVLAVVVAGAMGYAALALHLGRALPFHFDRGAPILQLAIGTALLVAIGRIPILGWLCWIAAWMLVFGAVLRTRFGQPPATPPVYGTTAAPPSMPPPMPPAAPPGAPPPTGTGLR